MPVQTQLLAKSTSVKGVREAVDMRENRHQQKAKAKIINVNVDDATVRGLGSTNLNGSGDKTRRGVRVDV